MAQPTGFPAPLTPAYVDLRNLPTMPLDVARLRDSKIATAASGAEFQAAILLWCAAWHQIPAGTLPDDDIELAKLAGFGRVVDAWLAVKPGALYGWTRCADGRLHHRYIASIVRERWEYRLNFEFSRYCDRARKANHAAKAKSLPEKEILSFADWSDAEIARLSAERDHISDGKSEPFQGIPPEIALKERKGKERKGKEIKTKGDARGKIDPESTQKPASPELPEWLKPETWALFLKHRGSKFTAHAQELTIKKLGQFRALGHDPGDILETSIANGWKGVFEPKINPKGKATIHDERKRASDALSGRDGS